MKIQPEVCSNSDIPRVETDKDAVHALVSRVSTYPEVNFVAFTGVDVKFSWSTDPAGLVPLRGSKITQV